MSVTICSDLPLSIAMVKSSMRHGLLALEYLNRSYLRPRSNLIEGSVQMADKKLLSGMLP